MGGLGGLGAVMAEEERVEVWRVAQGARDLD